MQEAQRHSQRPPADASTKAAPSKQHSDIERREPADTRHRLRNALPGSNHTHRHREKQHRSTRQAAKDTVQSALELRPPISFDHLLRRDKRTPAQSRRNSAHDGNDLKQSQQQTRVLQTRIGLDDVNKIKQENEQREHDLRGALQRVEEQGMQSTRQLDNTYYNLLEKAEALRDIVSNMQRLARESRRLREDFKEQSQEIHGQTGRAIEEHHNFSQQEKSIKVLLARLETYKERTASLNERLEAAKTRVEVCERHIIDAQAQRKKRWGITWAAILSVVLVVLAVLIARQPTDGRQLNTKIGSAANDAILPVLAKLNPTPSEDPYLHSLFDGIS